MRKNIILLLLIVNALFSHAQHYRVNIAKSIIKEIHISDVLFDIKSVDIIIPDTIELQNQYVYLTEDGNHLLVINLDSSSYLFDVKGKFIKEINGNQNFYVPNHYFDVKRNILYKDNLKEWIGIDVFTNKIVKRIVRPSLFKDQLANFMQISDNEFIGFVNNQSGNCATVFVIFDDNGQILYREPNKRTYTKVNRDSPWYNGVFYEYDSHHYCLEPFMGTMVYEVGEKILYPHIYFYAGKKTPIYEFQDLNRENQNKRDEWRIFKVRETHNSIYFTYLTIDGLRWGYYSKKEEQTYMAPVSGKNARSTEIDKECFSPAFLQDRYSVTSKLDGDTLKVIIGTFK